MTGIAARAREIALTLTSWPSVTGTADEARFVSRLAEYLTGFDRVWTASIENDEARRGNVFALKRGRGATTIVLTGHFDVVPVEDYGELQHLAFAPERLLPELIGKLRATGESPLALADLESGEYLPGRGLLDMKAGLAAGLAAIETYEGETNLLFVAVCDEEDRSAGARAAAPQIARIADEYRLDIVLVINLDAISDQGDGIRLDTLSGRDAGRPGRGSFDAGLRLAVRPWRGPVLSRDFRHELFRSGTRRGCQ